MLFRYPAWIRERIQAPRPVSFVSGTPASRQIGLGHSGADVPAWESFGLAGGSRAFAGVLSKLVRLCHDVCRDIRCDGSLLAMRRTGNGIHWHPWGLRLHTAARKTSNRKTVIFGTEGRIDRERLSVERRYVSLRIIRPYPRCSARYWFVVSSCRERPRWRDNARFSALRPGPENGRKRDSSIYKSAGRGVLLPRFQK